MLFKRRIMKLLILGLAMLAITFANAEDHTCEQCCCEALFVSEAEGSETTTEDINEFLAGWSCPNNCQTDEQCQTGGFYDDCTAPTTKSGALSNYYLQMMSQNGDLSPQMLSLLANTGSGLSSKELIKQTLLAQMGLKTEFVHLILNNGKFADDTDKNKNAMINFLASSGSIPPALVPFLLKADNAKEFFTISMIENSNMNPLMGLFMLASVSDDFDKDTILELITESMFNGNVDDMLYGITTPYIPELPQGIFPGSQLRFAHFEGLGISTCALHDLRNRFECGYTGISAADCEYAPYCCYSPVFLTDKQVQESSEGAIVSASAVPWCFYNIFFVYYEQFYLEVKQIGEFPAPLQCPPFWKYGLNIDDSMVGLISGNSAFSKLVNERADCGFGGITEFHCIAIRGCCFDDTAPYGQPQCYKPKSIPTFNPDNIPEAYKPVIGMCNMNRHKIPTLYYQRKAANYPLIFHQYGGYNIFKEPTREDCLTKLGACYEDDEDVVAKYPALPRCYQRTTAGNANGVSPFSTLQLRTGEDPDFKGFPPVMPETTTAAQDE